MQSGGKTDLHLDEASDVEARTAAPSSDPSDWNGAERRAADRRDRPTRPWSGWLTPRRRARGRRESDRASYVDRYSRRDVVLLLSVFLLNVGDAWMTMLWLSRGGREANPVMDFFLDISPAAFLVQKCLVVGFWLLILIVHKNFRFARIGLYASLVVYALLMLLHFGIVALGSEPPAGDALAEASGAPAALETARAPAAHLSRKESAHQQRNDRLDAQHALPQPHRLEADAREALDLVVDEATLRPNENRDGRVHRVWAGFGAPWMRQQSAALLDPRRQHLFDQGLEVPLEPDLRQARVRRLLEPEQQAFAYGVGPDHVAVPEALLRARRPDDEDRFGAETREGREQPSEDRRARQREHDVERELRRWLGVEREAQLEDLPVEVKDLRATQSAAYDPDPKRVALLRLEDLVRVPAPSSIESRVSRRAVDFVRFQEQTVHRPHPHHTRLLDSLP